MAHLLSPARLLGLALLVLCMTLPGIANGASAAAAAPFVSTSVTLPSGISSYVPIAIYNNQSVATPAPFQQVVSVPSVVFERYERPTLHNVQFFYGDGRVIPSWLEYGASNASNTSLYWLQLANGISANSHVTIYMGFSSRDTMDGIHAGEAPQLSSPYGRLDNGAQVFSMYSGFVNSTTPAFISSLFGAGTGNVVTIGKGISWAITTNTPMGIGLGSINGSYVVSLDETSLSPGVNASWYSNAWAETGTAAGASCGASYKRVGGEGYWSGHAFTSPAPPILGVFVFSTSSTGVNAQWYRPGHYSSLQTQSGSPTNFCSSSTNPGSFNGIYIQAGIGDSFYLSFQWVQIRALPPLGVMPSASVSRTVL